MQKLSLGGNYTPKYTFFLVPSTVTKETTRPHIQDLFDRSIESIC